MSTHREEIVIELDLTHTFFYYDLFYYDFSTKLYPRSLARFFDPNRTERQESLSESKGKKP